MKEQDARLVTLQDAKDRIKQNLYYIIIGITSFLSVTFLPLVGSTIGLKWKLPDTTAGWIVWVVSRLIIATINVLIFHSFMEQAKLNVKDNEHYIEAREILYRNRKKEHEPQSPQKWLAWQYGKKGTTIFFFSVLSLVALGQAILTFDLVAMLAYIFTIALGVIFGIMQMKKAEAYWTGEFYEYALKKQQEQDTATEEVVKDKEIADDND